MLAEDHLKAFLEERRAKKLFHITLFSLLGFVIVNTWRGLWMLLDYYTTTSLTSGCVSHAVGFFMVLSTKTTSSITAAPSWCMREKNDRKLESILYRKLWLNTGTTSRATDIASRIVNSFFTVFVTGAGVISYWRGTWIVMDALTMPQESDKLKSSIVSICTGYSVFVVCYIISEFVLTAKNLTPPFSLRCRALEQVYVYILGFGTVNCWRGIWYIEDVYLLPDRPVVSSLVGHFGGVAILCLLQTSIILVCAPAGCRVHGSEWLEGFNLGSFLEKSPAKDGTKEMESRTEDSYHTFKLHLHGRQTGHITPKFRQHAQTI